MVYIFLFLIWQIYLNTTLNMRMSALGFKIEINNEEEDAYCFVDNFLTVKCRVESTVYELPAILRWWHCTKDRRRVRLIQRQLVLFIISYSCVETFHGIIDNWYTQLHHFYQHRRQFIVYGYSEFISWWKCLYVLKRVGWI